MEGSYNPLIGSTGFPKACVECLRIPTTHSVMIDGEEGDFCNDHPSDQHIRLMGQKPRQIITDKLLLFVVLGILVVVAVAYTMQ